MTSLPSVQCLTNSFSDLEGPKASTVAAEQVEMAAGEQGTRVAIRFSIESEAMIG